MNFRLKIIEIMAARRNPMVLIIVGFFLLAAWLVDGKAKTKDQSPPTEIIQSVDTYIPDGFSMIPIQIQNLSALDSFVGQFAVVDVYAAEIKSALGKSLRLIRSPINPAEFSVLVPDEFADEFIARSQKPVFVIIQNPNDKKTLTRKVPAAKRLKWED